MSDLTVPTIIAQQIGHKAFVMMGTRYKLADEKSLAFDVRGSKRWNKIQITLNAMDTYDVTFWKFGRAPLFREQAKQACFGISFDQLHELIEKHTGLYLSLT